MARSITKTAKRETKPSWPIGMLSAAWSRLAGFAVIVLVPFGLIGPAAADEDTDCAHAADTPTILECAGDALTKADDELNVVYRKAMASQVATDKALADTSMDAGAASALKKAQRAWIIYRDAHCEGIAFQDAGGTARPIDEVECETDLTKERITRLKELIGGRN